MEITKQSAGQFTELVIKGRLDGYWADHLTSALEDVVRGGADHVRLNLAGVSYISSMGIRVLLKVYQQLNGINGALVVSNPSEPVKRVLEMMHLGKLLDFRIRRSRPGRRSRNGSSYRSQNSLLRSIRLRPEREARMRRGGQSRSAFELRIPQRALANNDVPRIGDGHRAWRVRPSFRRL